ncbi:cell cycle progression protein 1 isoform X1 [Rissa tridactyla]|uniref:cell cycle progression protein 1 isoform X1 n=1 Tax=Rissa tridactyla TaxID=75485 RepID=UPI0023BA4635|nr:cell cycle progression protein 1 isoform X1 [Rissa tridactyla]XP_054070945.1 cell cycle progression protein 1 isoform X1 [Rissa tridactyla]XP_054070946.1 cell cycle progression protein 1 isoform X1 [Rissa tridactyla]XP_054070947.1 cell cycle progression protein 1 isoform X1 [Rissa tridactyla]
MSENSSDSDSSCGWTVINHEGSDIETVTSENGSTNDNHEFVSEEYVSLQEEEQPVDLQAQCSNDGEIPVVDNTLSAFEETQTVPEGKKEKIPDDGSCIGTISDDSDIVTLEAPKPEETQSQEEAPADGEEAQNSEDFNMGSSSSSQYAFSHLETVSWLEKLRKIPDCVRGWGNEVKEHVSRSPPFQVFSSQASNDESSSDETSNQSSPAVRKRRAKKRLISSSEAEGASPAEPQPEPPREEQHKRQFGSGLNRCIILALVIAISMGFGHFYGKPEGTIQVQKRQQLVTKTRELKDMKDDLYQCQQEQGENMHHKVGSLKGDLATCLTSTEVEKKSFESQKKSLAAENQHLRESLEKEEKALASLQEELRKLRQQIRNLEDKGTSTESIVMENQKLREHLEEEKQRNHNFLRQKETLFAEAQMLRRELDKERHVTEALKKELEQLSSRQTPDSADDDTLRENQEIEILRGRLVELEKKLNFEQQRSDLWEKLYVEAKDQTKKQEMNEKGQKKSGKGQNKTKKKSKESFFGSVKETFDAMKNSTKEFVRHHKEKIKQAKEAVKENLKKFSDSVKSTFRHFKDTTKNIFDEKKKLSDKRHEANKKARTFYREPNSYENLKHTHYRGPNMPKEFRDGRKQQFTTFEKDTDSQKCLNDPLCNRKHQFVLKGCSGIFECAHQEFISLFNRVSDPIRVDEFNRLMKKYLQQVVHNFHHWRELESFINKFFHNGVFIHDQMLFTDFVNDVKDYLEDMKEYQNNNEKVFEDLDQYIYRYYFHYDNLPQYGPSRPKRPSFTQTENSRHEKQAQKYHHRNKREGKWHKHGRTNGRHMANLEIELGQLPFDPKY